jgi:hypothetical protein
MSETPRRILHLTIDGFPADKIAELSAPSSDVTEVFALTEASAREALEKIFAADTVTVWGKLA